MMNLTLGVVALRLAVVLCATSAVAGARGQDSPPPIASRTIEELRRDAESGEAQALTMLAIKLWQTGDSTHNKEILQLLRKAAAKNDPKACAALGAAYQGAFLGPRDARAAIEYYKKAFELGEKSVAREIGAIYSGNDGVPENWPEAERWTRIAADAGDSEAMFNLSIMLERRAGGNKSSEEALEWLRRAADAGIPQAQYNLSIRFREKDWKNCVKYAKLAADSGLTEAIAEYGVLGVTKDLTGEFTEPFAYLYVACGRGADNARRCIQAFEAQYSKEIRESGEQKAEEIHRRIPNKRLERTMASALVKSLPAPPRRMTAMSFGDLEVEADGGDIVSMLRMADCYRLGDGTPKDADEERKWLEKASAAGSSRAKSRLLLNQLGDSAKSAAARAGLESQAAAGELLALRVTGARLFVGSDGQKDQAEGLRRMTLAAEKGDPTSARVVGATYLAGDGVEKDIARGRAFLEKAAALGDAESLALLAGNIAAGAANYQKDLEACAILLVEASMRGYPKAMGYLAVAYARSEGVPQSCVQALCWLSIAEARNGAAIEPALFGMLQGMSSAGARERAQAAANSLDDQIPVWGQRDA